MTFGITTFVGAGGQVLGHFAFSFGAVALPDPHPHMHTIQPTHHGSPIALPKDFSSGRQKGLCHQEASWGSGLMGRARKLALSRNLVGLKVRFLE